MQNTVLSAEYWSQYHVDSPSAGFTSAKDSLAHFTWRNSCYPGYIESMPVSGADGKIVLDYGCGPANDLVGFGLMSKPRRLIGADVSELALHLAAKRVRLHAIEAEFLKVVETPVHIPLDDHSVDLIHCSGVLMMTPDPLAILQEFRRVIRPGGYTQIMVYHYHSIWMHLYVAYQKIILEGRYANMSKLEAFARTTDGEECPVSTAFSVAEFSELAATAGFACEFAGTSISTTEMKVLDKRWEALEEKRLDSESRRFLYQLTFDQRGLPLYDGRVAGINLACRLIPI